MIQINGLRQKTLEVGRLDQEMERPILLTSTSPRVLHLTLTLPSFAALEEGTMDASNCIQDLHLQQNLWQQFEIYMMPLDSYHRRKKQEQKNIQLSVHHLYQESTSWLTVFHFCKASWLEEKLTCTRMDWMVQMDLSTPTQEKVSHRW